MRKLLLAMAATIALAPNVNAAPFVSTGIPVPELVGPNCSRFSINGVQWAIGVENAQSAALMSLVIYAADNNLVVTAEEGGTASCAVPGVVHSTNFIHK